MANKRFNEWCKYLLKVDLNDTLQPSLKKQSLESLHLDVSGTDSTFLKEHQPYILTKLKTKP